ncbi:Ribosome biogenesis protein BMS1 like protein-related protein [Tritrichomonas foetus]|uniref:Ribosome biogenesis protein BMS1 like protein-related protein n=1 Tax=Tritrichomonas foetus TaxID=1144522 RepID=A0A1J4J8F5_9EUKA|nr:Ribosome biogenesis protein BMS1 like protein-related protein [Tritrichomonas foetus]|eukprot:OHS93685.1 Ribosome biogenesis protein BMS1 like protein-related protein [Tritrichomonas foetus]
MTIMEQQKPNKPHQAPHKGKSGEDIHNIKANGYYKGERARQAIAHQVNIEQIRLHQPETRAYSYEDPPLIIAVQGPPKCGKTLLIKCLVKHFSKQVIVDVRGPVTVIANRGQRITFIEVPNDLNAMTDVAKIADLVLLMVNAQHNFEMETFEFLNLLLSHGFPKVIGILTHLDLCDKSVASQLISRFHKELNTTVKVYKLERLIHGKYEKKSILNLSRRLTIPKVRVINFRKKRGYVLVDRAEAGANGSTLLYGYTRGDGLSNKQRVHIPGAGDYTIAAVTELPDPCPLANPKTVSQRTLRQQSNHMYAPMSEIGGIKMDDDAIYVDLPKHQLNFTNPNSDALKLTQDEKDKLKDEIQVTKGVELVREMQQRQDNAENQQKEKITLFEGVEISDDDEEPQTVSNPPIKEENKEEEIKVVQNENDDDGYEYEEEEEDVGEKMMEMNYEEEDNLDNNEDFMNASDDEDGPDDPNAPPPSGEIPPGKYVKVEFSDIPESLIQRLNPRTPIIIGGLLPEEYAEECSQQWVKIKRHRFYERKPKSSDPMIVTIGWRRFQAIPIFFNEERDGKLRFLKYMPDFLTCYATFYGPPPANNIGVTAFQHIKENLRAFRITATGVTIPKMGDGNVVKKLRVNGHPKEIYRKTAKITDMFTSELEAGQFVGALVRTVSGIRGVIKKAEKDGVVRCTFEDTVKKSDIIFLNGWVKVPPTNFYQTIDSLLTDNWNLVRTTAELRSDLNLRPEYNEDSVYKDVTRPELPELKLTVPKNLKQQLPYKVRKEHEKTNTRIAVIANQEESDIMEMIRKTTEVFNQKKKEKMALKKAQDEAAKKLADKEEEIKMHKRTLRKQEFFKRNPKKAGRK